MSLLGGNIGAAWAAMQHLGEDGYMKKAEELMATTQKLIEGIKMIPVKCEKQVSCNNNNQRNPSLDLPVSVSLSLSSLS